jgi:hypothetical protein
MSLYPLGIASQLPASLLSHFGDDLLFLQGLAVIYRRVMTVIGIMVKS